MTHEPLPLVRNPPDGLFGLYRGMLRIRRFEEQVLELRQSNAIQGSVHLCMGQELVPTVAARVLRETDPILATYRGHGWALAAGVPMVDMFAEILGRAGGTNGGRAGSAYLSSPSHRFLGENSIVGAGLPIAVGVALAGTLEGSGDVVFVAFGDGATNQGASHEAMVLAVARGLPVVFVCENNGWSEMTAIRDMVPVPLADRARAYGMDAFTVDGTDPEASQAALTRAAIRARSGEGPSFLEFNVPRIAGHYNADIEHYRTEEDKAHAASRDPLTLLRKRLIESGVPDASLADLERAVSDEVQTSTSDALAQPLPDPADAREHVWSISTPHPSPLPTSGKSVAFGLAVNEALRRDLAERPEMIVFGEDVAAPGGVFGVTRNLQKQFGGARVFDTPISESAILGGALGASLRGARPVVEVMWIDFLLVALDQLVNQAANVRYLSGGRANAPMVVRTQQGATPGSCAQHTQSLEALLVHIPGIKVGVPSNSHDGYVMTRAAIADEDPVVMIEARAMYLEKSWVDFESPPEPVGGARLRRTGCDVLVVSWGRMVNEALAAADSLADEGISAGVLDMRWLAPLDTETLLRAARDHGGRVVVAQEANLTGGVASQISALLYESGAAARVERIGAPDVPLPASPALQLALLPSAATIAARARIVLGWSAGDGR